MADAVRVQYYAILREQRGASAEEVTSSGESAGALYTRLAEAHGFTLPASVVRVAVNGEFAEWDRTVRPGDTVVFIPPVAGG